MCFSVAFIFGYVCYLTLISVNAVLQKIAIGPSFCGDYNFNHPIASTDADIRASYTAVFENSIVTSLKVKRVHDLLIALAGTSSGQLLKVNKKHSSVVLCQ